MTLCAYRAHNLMQIIDGDEKRQFDKGELRATYIFAAKQSQDIGSQANAWEQLK